MAKDIKVFFFRQNHYHCTNCLIKREKIINLRRRESNVAGNDNIPGYLAFSSDYFFSSNVGSSLVFQITRRKWCIEKTLQIAKSSPITGPQGYAFAMIMGVQLRAYFTSTPLNSCNTDFVRTSHCPWLLRLCFINIPFTNKTELDCLVKTQVQSKLVRHALEITDERWFSSWFQMVEFKESIMCDVLHLD